VTAVGLGLVGLAAVLFGRDLLKPAAERKERDTSVLTGLHDPKVIDCRFLEDSEVPEELPRPGVGEDWRYLLVEVLYPAAAKAPDPEGHYLDQVDGGPSRVPPAHVEAGAVDESGAYLALMFRVESAFGRAVLRRGDAVVASRVSPE